MYDTKQIYEKTLMKLNGIIKSEPFFIENIDETFSYQLSMINAVAFENLRFLRKHDTIQGYACLF